MLAFVIRHWEWFAGFLLAVGIAIAVLLYGNHKYDAGYNARDLTAKLEMETLRADLEAEKNAEINRQIAANKTAQENSAKRVQQIETEKQDLERLLKENEDAANNDKNSKRIGLDPSSVLRLNKIK